METIIDVCRELLTKNMIRTCLIGRRYSDGRSARILFTLIYSYHSIGYFFRCHFFFRCHRKQRYSIHLPCSSSFLYTLLSLVSFICVCSSLQWQRQLQHCPFSIRSSRYSLKSSAVNNKINRVRFLIVIFPN